MPTLDQVILLVADEAREGVTQHGAKVFEDRLLDKAPEAAPK